MNESAAGKDYDEKALELMKALHEAGMTAERAKQLILGMAQRDFVAGYNSLKIRLRKWLEERRDRDFKVLKEKGLLRDDQEVVIPIKEILDLLNG